MPKPTDLPVWSTDATYPMDAAPEQGAPTTIEPTAPKQAVGWRPGETPKATYLNWWQNLVYLWILYVDSNAIDGNLTVAGSVEATSHVEGTLLYHTSAERLLISAAASRDAGGVHTMQSSGTIWTLAASAGRIVYPLPLHVGDVITGWTIPIDKHTSSAATVTGRLYRRAGAGAEAALGVGDADNSNGSVTPFVVDLVESGLSITVAAGFSYYLVLTPSGVAGDFATHAEVTYTHPSP